LSRKPKARDIWPPQFIAAKFGAAYMFFIEHARELRIISLYLERSEMQGKISTTTLTHTNTHSTLEEKNKTENKDRSVYVKAT